MSLLEAAHVTAGYDHAPILHEVSCGISPGEFVALAGPNGAGKTTLFRVLAGLLKPMGGEVRWRGQPLAAQSRKAVARELAIVFQQFDCRYEYTVEDLVQLGRLPHEPALTLVSRMSDAAVERAMDLTDTAVFRDRLFTSLSGGEQQRVTLAMALAQQPVLLLLDEPASHLDIGQQVALYRLLARLREQQNLTLVLTTHDLSLAAQFVDRVLLLRQGRLQFDGPVREGLTPQRLEALYDVPLLVQDHPHTGRPLLYPALGEG